MYHTLPASAPSLRAAGRPSRSAPLADGRQGACLAAFTAQSLAVTKPTWQHLPLSFTAGLAGGSTRWARRPQGAVYVTNNAAFSWTAAVQETVDATLNRTVSSGARPGGSTTLTSGGGWGRRAAPLSDSARCCSAVLAHSGDMLAPASSRRHT